MGKCNYYAIGYGMTKQEARRNAIEEDMIENGHQQGYSGTISSSTRECDKSKCIREPIKAKTCNVDKSIQKGARKWETVYVLSFDCMEMPVVTEKTQREAIKKAKEIAINYGCKVNINIKKRLVNSNSCIAIVTPKKNRIGKWEFTGLARE